MRKRISINRRYKREPGGSTTAQTMTEIFEEFMLIKKSEGLARRTIAEYSLKYYKYFKEYVGRELSAEEMTTELSPAGLSICSRK
jgi:integrase/recombinase XerD